MKKMKKYLEVAKFTKPQGLKGEMRALLYCDSVNFLNEFHSLLLGAEKKPYKLSYAKPYKDMAIIKLECINDATEAEKYVGKMLYIDREDVELPEDVWFVQDLYGLPVFDADTGEEYGKVKEILQNAPVDVYLIEKDGKELMFPAIPEVLISVNIEGREIKIRPLEGLFDE